MISDIRLFSPIQNYSESGFNLNISEIRLANPINQTEEYRISYEVSNTIALTFQSFFLSPGCSYKLKDLR